ncbi:hypothetical protein CJ219_04765 [Haemophilus parainfluenzae]|jgi:genome|uniref:Uncharacterized protein n=1 Tax=Haemophilus parainfluenzae ATCC 33392 TaxID=888828 RepID=A0ABD7ZE10_HAEPA|nr:hypothetical protein [Haemophilus parainfluenzae]EGC72521.1 hypothetical protein HMPREF9417_0666 [Haemophilus parainfluenzae ATCC 33392]KFL98449.1 conserved domain protein [Haemophilus parainfluenzae ATCC 33392]MBS4797464.1 hypothetical protein [Haemophilus parainfluenzae]PMC57044.1 hypothetical protein CJ219_04765 [Haemophilus parainfluenzae]QQB23269.1 hypothetical protein I6H57_01090 [Haemophilus parainfluenzae]
MELKWITDNLFPNFVQNLSIIATILGTVITCCVWFKTNKLYKLYNEKSSNFYITDQISQAYDDYTKEITAKGDFEEQKLAVWKLIKKINGIVITYEHPKTSIGKHVGTFKSETKMFINLSKDNLTYEDAWSYYNHLATLSQALKNIQALNARKAE